MDLKSESSSEKVIIGIVNFNGKSRLAKTLDAAIASDHDNFEVIVADNLSTDGSREWLQVNYPDISCLHLTANRGPAAARNALLRASDATYVLFLDDDMVLEPETLDRLMQIIQLTPQIAACHPEICDRSDPSVHHYNGGSIHYLGALISRPKPSDERPDYEVFDIVSGGALLVRRHVAQEVGYFDEDYFFNWEDGDFVARLTLSGYVCVNVPEAIAHHRQKNRGTSKAYYMVRNRGYFILKLYDWKTLFLIAPALFVFELFQAALLILKGEFPAYIRANLDLLKNLPAVLHKRRKFQKLKKKSDRDWLYSDDVYVSTNFVGVESWLSRLKILIFRGFDIYWRLVRPFCVSTQSQKASFQKNYALGQSPLSE